MALIKVMQSCVPILTRNDPAVDCYELKSSSLEILLSLGKWVYRTPSTHMNTLVSLKALGEDDAKLVESNLETKSYY